MHAPERVDCAVAPRAGYGACPAVAAPELPAGWVDDVAAVTLRALLRHAGLDAARFGTPGWNPLGDLVRPGERVVLKPNWVHHRNRAAGGTLDSLVTHTSLVEAVARYVALARPATLVVGDAPIQGCDFAALCEAAGVDGMAARLRADGIAADVRDFRRKVLPGGRIGGRVEATGRTDPDYVLFDLGVESALEPVSGGGADFRVTKYHPDRLRETHRPGRHQYLVAREVIEADVVVNLPKLKTHKKSGITGALKNLVGINGLKDYLPHHRKGGSARGGDCYPGGSPLKRAAEELLDHANRSPHPAVARLAEGFARAALAGEVALGGDGDVEGSWAGNDTVWRMCLDLQRILHYGRADGTLAATPQRRVVTITDGVVAGEGDGPLAPLAMPLGVLTFALSTAAAEWAHALLMGMDPRRIPLLCNAFAPGPLPLAAFAPEAVRATVDGRELADVRELAAVAPRPFLPPRGWRGACELVPAAGRAA